MRRVAKKFLAFICGVCAIVCLAFSCIEFVVFPFKSTMATAESINLTEELETQYLIGDILQIPSATIIYENSPYVADPLATVYLPDYSVLKCDRLTLNLVGNYKIVYETTVSGVRVTAEKSFVVTDKAYLLPNSSSYSFSETVRTQSTQHFDGGLNVELSSGAEFVYNKAIDISETSMSIPVLTFSPYQYSNYMLDAEGRPVVQANEFFVRLTDAYDPDNYIELYMLNRSKELTTHEPGKRSYPYMSVGASGQIKYAIDNVSRYAPESNNGKLVELDGNKYCVVYKEFGVNHGLIPYGQAIDNSGIGNDGHGGWFSVYYDVETARVYVEAPIRNGKSPAIIKRIMLNDLDSSNIYGENTFKGFTTGEIYLSIRADNYLSDKVQFELLEVCGEKGSALAETTVNDTRAPLLIFDAVEENDVFFVQRNVLTTLPAAIAYDVNLKGEVETRVYYAYGTDKQVLINSDGGEFTPTKTGTYIAEYIAMDVYGNKTIKMLTFSSLDSEVLNFNVDQLESGFGAGASLILPKHEISSLNGDTYVNIFATIGDKKIDIEEETRELFIDYVGEYTIVYKYGDVLTNKTFSYKVTSMVSDSVTFGDFKLPQYFIKNSYYTFDTVYAYTYRESMPKAMETSVFVSEDGSPEFNKISFESYLVEANQTVQFKYVYGESVAYSEKLPVIDVGFGNKLSLEKYFIGDITATVQKSYVELISGSVSGDTTVKFANPIALSFFRFEFSVPEGVSAFDGVEIKLTDYYNRNISLTLAYYKNQNMTQFRVGAFSADIAQSFADTKFAVWYEITSKKMAEFYGISTKFENHFTSDRVFIEFTLKNAKGLNGIRVAQICNQPMTSNSRDRYPAAFSYENLFGGLNEIGKEVTVFAGEATDVLSPYYAINMFISVEKPSGGYVIATDGTLLHAASATISYNFITEEYGKYIVTYLYRDQNAQEVTGMYNIVVVDMQSPTITLKDGFGERTRVFVKSGTEITVAEYMVSDNITPASELKTVIFVMRANGEFVEVNEGRFFAKNKGDYTVYYYCYDTDDNYSVVKYYVRAE